MIYVLLLVVGVKATWNLAFKIFPTSVDSVVGAIIVFLVIFFIIGPIMGIVTLVKMVILKINTGKN